jgi:hypothetical protein
MDWVYTATWECGETHPPETIRGEVTALDFAAAIGRAARESQRKQRRAHPGRHTATVLVLVERKEDAERWAAEHAARMAARVAPA